MTPLTSGFPSLRMRIYYASYMFSGYVADACRDRAKGANLFNEPKVVDRTGGHGRTHLERV